MKQFKDIKKKIKWEQYYNPDFDWDNFRFYTITENRLSEEFIREFQNKVDWSYISKYQTLSENFIKEFQDRVDWWYISEYQKLSENFIREFQDKVNLDYIYLNQKISKEIKVKLKIV